MKLYPIPFYPMSFYPTCHLTLIPFYPKLFDIFVQLSDYKLALAITMMI